MRHANETTLAGFFDKMSAECFVMKDSTLTWLIFAMNGIEEVVCSCELLR